MPQPNERDLKAVELEIAFQEAILAGGPDDHPDNEIIIDAAVYVLAQAMLGKYTGNVHGKELTPEEVNLAEAELAAVASRAFADCITFSAEIAAARK